LGIDAPAATRLKPLVRETKVVAWFEEEHLNSRLLRVMVQKHGNHSQRQLQRLKGVDSSSVPGLPFPESVNRERGKEAGVIRGRSRFAEPDDDIGWLAAIRGPFHDPLGDYLADVFDRHWIIINTVARLVAPGLPVPSFATTGAPPRYRAGGGGVIAYRVATDFRGLGERLAPKPEIDRELCD